MAADFRRDGVRSSLVWNVLGAVVSARVAETGRQVLDIVDVGGGTGGLAVPFAVLGHNVTVVDPSPDALAAAQRRAAEAGARLASVQGDAASLDSVAGTAAADLVICHNVLEYVDSPADAMSAIARVLRPSATVSVLASNSVATVLHRALVGRFAEARRLLASSLPQGRGDQRAAGLQGAEDVQGGPGGFGPPRIGGDLGRVVPSQGGSGGMGPPTSAGGLGRVVPSPGGSEGIGHPTSAGGLGEVVPPGETPRRFTLPELTALIEEAGLHAGEAHGVRIFSGLVPGVLLDGDAAATEALRALEEAAASIPPLRDIAAQLHVLAHR